MNIHLQVLTSIYPVKPRKTLKVNNIPLLKVPAPPLDGDGVQEYDSKIVDQTLAFIDSIRRSKKDLYNAECERENLDIQTSVSMRT